MKKIRLTVYSIFTVIPLIAMANCSGWSANDMQVSACMIDVGIFREFSSYLYNLLYIAASMKFIPLAFYFIFMLVLAEALVFFAKRSEKE